ncbi:MAG: MMPL family transporter [Thermodesulfobacteriota bacterium]
MPEISQKTALLVVVVLSLASAACIYLNRDRASEDISVMLPAGDEDVLRDMRFLRNSPWADKIFIRLAAGPDISEDELKSAAQKFADSLPEKYFPRVMGMENPDPRAFLHFYLSRLPLLLAPQDLTELGKDLNPARVRERMRENHALLTGPRGFVLKEAVRSDPLDLRRFFLSRLKGLRGFAPLKTGKGFVLDKEGKSALVTATCTVKPTDSEGSKDMLAALDRVRAKTLPPDIEYTPVSAHVYSAANARIIRSDMNLVLGISLAGLLMVFGLFLRRARALWVVLLPACSLLWATAAYCLTFSALSGIVLGFGAVLLGLTLDFGVHVYMAGETGKPGENRAGKVLTPLAASGLTTCFGFLVLSFSSISGIRQLSFLAVTGIVIACFFALFILPALLKNPGGKSRDRQVFSLPLPRKNFLWLWIFLLFLLGCAAPFIRFSGDLREVGYFPEKLKQTEKEIKKMQGGRQGNTMFVAHGDTLQDSLHLNDILYRELGDGGRDMASISPLLPSKKTQAFNLAAWREFWDEEKREKIEKWLTEAGSDFGFSPSAFDSFFRLTDPENAPQRITLNDVHRLGLGDLTQLFLGSGELNQAVFSYPGSGNGAEQAFSARAEERPGIHLVSESEMRRRLGGSVKKDLLLYAGLGFLVIAAFLLVIFRKPREMFLAFLPPLSAVLALTGIFALTGTALNLFHVAGIPLVIGLGVDYGIFMVYRGRARRDVNTPEAVFISGLSTILAFGALVFARHPALHSLGLSVLIGVLAASACALLILPAAGRKT